VREGATAEEKKGERERTLPFHPITASLQNRWGKGKSQSALTVRKEEEREQESPPNRLVRKTSLHSLLQKKKKGGGGADFARYTGKEREKRKKDYYW